MALALWGAVVTSGTAARADLHADADRLARQWRSEGAAVRQLPPSFLEGDAPRLFETGDPLDEAMCTTVVALGERTTELRLYPLVGSILELPPGHAAPGRDDEDDSEGEGEGEASEEPGGDSTPSSPERAEQEGPVESEGGFALLRRCGPRQRELSRVLALLATTRGAVEVIVARTSGMLTLPQSLLPERVEGPRAPRGSAGAPLPPGSITQRLEGAERRARVAGAKHVVQVPMRSSSQGSGLFELRMGEGCHRIEVMAESTATHPVDVDVEVRDEESGEILERDRGDAPDARVDLCFGETTVIGVSYVGAPSASQVVLSSAMWPIPDWIPAAWGARARASFATAFRRRPTPMPQAPPVALALGVQGVTSIPVEIEPASCYLAAVAMMQGDSAGLRLRATVGARGAVEEIPGRPEGVAVVFCSTQEKMARVEVEVRGQAPSWMLSAWRLGDP